MLARIVRHAERQKMPSELGIFDSSFDEALVPITQTGIKACRDNANALLKDCSLIYHSQILRCRQTAEHINYQNSLTILGESAY
jgi:broad specificity phosphatase PhoE